MPALPVVITRHAARQLEGAEIPDLRGCSAFGASPAEALAEVEPAKAVWLEVARAEDKPTRLPASVRRATSFSDRAPKTVFLTGDRAVTGSPVAV